MKRIAAIIICLLMMATGEIFANQPIKVMIFPLDADANTETPEWLGEGIALSIGDQLQDRDLKVIRRSERIQVVETMDLPPGGRLSRGSMIRVAQQAEAALLVMGSFSGSPQSLKVALRVFHLRTLKLSGEMTANGPLSALPQMENELAWMILSNVGLEKSGTRADFQKRTRKATNEAYACYIQSFGSSSKTSQIRLLKKAIELYRDFPQAHFQLGKLYFSKRDCENALPHLDLGLEGRTDAELDFMRGTCYLQKGQNELSISLMAPVLAHSRSYEALNNLGVAYLRQGDITAALGALVEARNASRKDATVSQNLAIAYSMNGDSAAARAVIEESIPLHSKNGMLHCIHSRLLAQQGESEKAAEAMSRARGLGINVSEMSTADLKNWTRILFPREP